MLLAKIDGSRRFETRRARTSASTVFLAVAPRGGGARRTGRLLGWPFLVRGAWFARRAAQRLSSAKSRERLRNGFGGARSSQLRDTAGPSGFQNCYHSALGLSSGHKTTALCRATVVLLVSYIR